MRRVARVVVMLLIGVLPVAASARPFEMVPRSDQVYTYLAVLDHEGLLAGDTTYQSGRSLTRTECAMIVKSTCENVARLATGSQGRVSDDPRLGQVVDALLRLLDALGPELRLLHAEVPTLREQITALPSSVASVAALRADVSKGHVPGGLSVAQPRQPWVPRLADTMGSAALSATSPGLGSGSAASGNAASRNAASGLTMSYQPIVARDPLGPSSLLAGQVFAADLRLRMGDTSVLVEYGRSLFEQRLGSQVSPEEGARLRTSFETALSDRLSIDLGYNRLSGNYRLFTALTPGADDGALSGLQAGVSWESRRWRLFGGATVLAPEHDVNSLYNMVGGQVTYRPTASWSVALGYQSNMRRSLASFEDTWRSFYDAKVAYALNQALRADLLYRFDTGEQHGSVLSPGSGEHFGGLSLSVGF